VNSKALTWSARGPASQRTKNLSNE
jgi:hypothetical protein